MWPVDDIFILPGVITSLCLDTVSARTGVGRASAVAGIRYAMWYSKMVTRQFLADRTGRAIGTVLRLSSSVCNVMYCG